MAAVTIGTVQSVSQFTTPAGPNDAIGWNSSQSGEIICCYVSVTLTGTYVQGTGYQLTCATIAAAIETARQDGATITIWDVQAGAPGQIEVAGVGTFIMAGTSTPSATPPVTVTGLLYTNNLSTEWSAGALGTWDIPLTFAVTFIAAPMT